MHKGEATHNFNFELTDRTVLYQYILHGLIIITLYINSFFTWCAEGCINHVSSNPLYLDIVHC